MKLKILTLLCALVPLLGAAQKTIISKNLSDFSKVNVTGNVTIKFEQATTNSVEIVLENASEDRFEWSVKNDQLTLRLKTSARGAKATVTLHYHQPLQEVKLTGANTVFDIGKADQFDLILSTGAVAKLRGEILDLAADVSSNSKLVVKGTAKYLTVRAGIGSTFQGNDMAAKAVTVVANTGSEVYVNATERLEVRSQTGSSVFYKGAPQLTRLKNGTFGTVNPIGK